jgi:hypothetical protein
MATEAINEHIETLKQRVDALRPGAVLNKPPDTVAIIQGLVDEHTFEGQAFRHLWRTGSAAAHGYHWPVMMQASDPGEFDEQSFNMSLYASMMMVKETVELYEIRALNHLGDA